MHVYFWPWLVLSLADAIIFLLKSRWNFKDSSMLLHNKGKYC